MSEKLIPVCNRSNTDKMEDGCSHWVDCFASCKTVRKTLEKNILSVKNIISIGSYISNKREIYYVLKSLKKRTECSFKMGAQEGESLTS